MNTLQTEFLKAIVDLQQAINHRLEGPDLGLSKQELREALDTLHEVRNSPQDWTNEDMLEIVDYCSSFLAFLGIRDPEYIEAWKAVWDLFNDLYWKL